MAGERIATALVSKYGDSIGTQVTECTLELEQRFLGTPVDTLAQWLDWMVDWPQAELLEAKRLVEEVRLLSWVHSQNSSQGVAPHPSLCGSSAAACRLKIAADSTRQRFLSDHHVVPGQGSGYSDSASGGALP